MRVCSFLMEDEKIHESASEKREDGRYTTGRLFVEEICQKPIKGSPYPSIDIVSEVVMLSQEANASMGVIATMETICHVLQEPIDGITSLEDGQKGEVDA